jgi:Uma2 family endonuclease
LNIDDYEQMIANGAFVGIDRRLEFIHGEIREMSPAGPHHYDYVAFLNRWSMSNTTAGEVSVQIQAAVLLGDSLPEPDVMWLRPKRYGGQRPRADDTMLIIEVADSSLRYDLGEKAMLYAQAAIKEYWVVDVASQAVHQLRQPTVDGYQDIRKFERHESLSPTCKPNVVLLLAELFSEE